MRIPKIGKPDIRSHLPEEFTVERFWEVARKVGKRGGRKLLSSAFTLYYCLRDSETPAWAKSVIIGALGYLVFPMDLIPDVILGAGFTDDLGVILGAMASVIAHITDEHRTKAAAMTERFLGSNDSGELAEDPVSIE